MKKLLILLLLIILPASVFFAGCSQNKTDQNEKATAVKSSNEEKKVVNKFGRPQSKCPSRSMDDNNPCTWEGDLVYSSFNGDMANHESKKIMKFNASKDIPLPKEFKNTGDVVTSDYIGKVHELNFINGVLYFINEYSQNDETICSINADGSNFKKIEKVIQPQYLLVYGDKIFFESRLAEGNAALFEMDTNGSNKIMLAKGDEFNSIYIEDDKVVFLYRSLSDGKLKENYDISMYDLKTKQLAILKSFDKNYSSLSALGTIVRKDYCYCSDPSTDSSFDPSTKKMVKINYSTGEKTTMPIPVSVDRPTVIYNDKIYYINYENNEKLYSCDLDGKNITKLTDDMNIDYIMIVKNKLFYGVNDLDRSIIIK